MSSSPEYVIAKEPLYIGTARAHNAGDRVLAADAKRNGWSDKVAAAESGEAEKLPGAFDPSRHNVEQVLAYLQDADEGEADRVLAAERDGKARTGILAAFEPGA